MNEATGVRPSKALNIGLWVVQVLLAAAFVMAGGMKIVTPIEELIKHMPWAADAPWLPRFIGTCEVAGAMGLILPAVTRIKPGLVPLAAAGLVLVMVLATAYHLSRGEVQAIPATIVLGALAAFVAWGRFRKAPIAPRA